MAGKAPKTTQERIGRDKGHFVAFSQQANGVLVNPKRIANPAEVLTPAEAKIVRRGEAQLKRRQARSWRALKDEMVR
jgi:hypothetical protein